MSLVEVDEAELAQLRIRASHQSAIETKNAQVERLRAEYQYKKDASLAAKKKLDEELAELSQLIAEGPSSQLSLPFKDEVPTKGEPVEPETHWRDWPVAKLNLPKATTEKLVELGITTVGKLKQIDDKKVPGYEEGLASIPSWGRGKVERAKVAMATVCGAFADFATEIAEEEPAAVVVPEEPELAAVAEASQSVTVELTIDVAGCSQFGLVRGAVFTGRVSGQNVVIEVGGKSVTLMSNEFRLIEQEATPADEPQASELVESVTEESAAESE